MRPGVCVYNYYTMENSGEQALSDKEVRICKNGKEASGEDEQALLRSEGGRGESR